MTRNIIVYASESALCRKLIVAMQNCGILNIFDKIDVCRPNARIPQGLSDIPTLIVSTCDEPLVGQKAFEWVEQRRMLLQQHSNMKKMISNNIYNWNTLKSNIGSTNNTIKMLGYSDLEMGNSSDMYAVVKDTANESFPQSFVNWNESITIYTGQEEKKLSKEQQNILLKNIESRRQEQDGAFKSECINIKAQLINGNLLPSQLSNNKLIDEKKQDINQNPQMMNSQMNPQLNPQMMNPQMMNPQMMGQQMMGQQMNPQLNSQMMNPQLNSQMMGQQMNPQLNSQMMNPQLNSQMMGQQMNPQLNSQMMNQQMMAQRMNQQMMNPQMANQQFMNQRGTTR